jgi:hypothetical protein
VAVCVASDLEDLNRIEQAWARHATRVPLEIIYSSDGAMTRAAAAYVDEIRIRWPDHTVTLLLPELAIRHWWEGILRNQAALALKARLLVRPGTVVTSVPYRRH